MPPCGWFSSAFAIASRVAQPFYIIYVGSKIRFSGETVGKPVGEEKDLLAEALGTGIVGEQFRQLIFEDAGATRLKKDERNPGLNLRRHAVENAREIGPSSIEKTEVVERAAAADVSAGNHNLKSCLTEYCLGGRERLRMVVVVPGIGPENYLRWSGLLDKICGGV